MDGESMRHEFAVSTHAAERYLLNEMSPEERDAFEGHYFSCIDCAEDLQTASRLIESAKSVWREDAESPPKASLFDWLRMKWLSPALLAVATAAVAVIAYQNVVTIPALNSPRALPALTLDLTSRAALPHLGLHDPLHFYVAAERAADSTTLWAGLSGESGKVLRSGSIPTPGPGQPIDVYFPGTVKAGRYIITIRSLPSGRPGELIARQTFEVSEEQTNR